MIKSSGTSAPLQQYFQSSSTFFPKWVMQISQAFVGLNLSFSYSYSYCLSGVCRVIIRRGSLSPNPAKLPYTLHIPRG